MIPLSTLLSRIRTLYDAESGGSSVRWTDAAIIAAVNEGLETLAESTLFYERYCTIPIEADRTYYDVRGATPETVVRPLSVWSSVRNDWLAPRALTDLDNQWERATGDPFLFFTRGSHWIGVYPRPSTTTGYFRIHFAGIPSPLNFPQAVLGDLPSDHYPALEDYVLYEMAAADRQPKRALIHWSNYVKRESALGKFVDRRMATSRHGRIGGFAERM